MRKLDTLILKAFFGPFVLTTVVATFVLLIQYMLKYFDDFVGKNLGFDVFAELLTYFSLNMLQAALPLGVLVSSLMTFGNLGENFELTAIKSAGISLVRALRPIFFFVIILTFAAFQFMNHVVPAANLKAYSLLYDIKHKKPALDIKEGVFYNGIPDYSIKVKEKLSDNKTLKDVLIYDHTDGKGNNRVILADSSRMFMMYNDKYLKLELYDGNYYSEESKPREPVDQFYRTKFNRMDMVFNLSSFDLKRTKEELFQNNRQMKNISELTVDIDSLGRSIYTSKQGFITNARGFFSYHLKESELKVPNAPPAKEEVKADTTEQSVVEASMLSFLTQNPVQKKLAKDPEGAGMRLQAKLPSTELKVIKDDQDSTLTAIDADSLANGVVLGKPKLDTMSWEYLHSTLAKRKIDVLQTAKNQAQNVKVNLTSVVSRVKNLEKDHRRWIIEKWKKYSQAFACIVMFLIGAPLGAIIKKGGLGVPVIVSILFFLVFYIIGIICEKSAKEGVMDPVLAVWVADLALLPIGLFFLRQARIDARLFDTDFYNVWIDKLKTRFSKK
ncbi:LptF/LptG family permease [Marinoscillum furvescens]|uniref:Lipopolysaccharide export system permease protein n=1 Tax=Marinoscillum furvescens DSM 4134 TaxID=1122208 RepID=A0A3D9L9V9_MARFU|nr:LptF/LptG family permease [Marinoscillum furvescens]REE02043.1 lipopolysaccharide export system permease protein [Marinoscillum furvescens DSM 4134]